VSIDPKSAPKQAPISLRRGFGSHVVRLAELALARAEAALQPLELTPLAYETMVCIGDGDGMSQTELSRQLSMYAPKMVGLLDGLEKKGLVERKVSPTDRRRHMLLLTPEGQELLQRAGPIAAALERELFGSLPEEDKARFEALVERLEAIERKREPD
jgi:DNA-binding MarR family transcriptional regulator